MELTCKEQINDQFADREADFANAYYYFSQADNCTAGEKIGLDWFFPDLKDYESFFDYINQYGLSWDYVQPEDVRSQDIIGISYHGAGHLMSLEYI